MSKSTNWKNSEKHLAEVYRRFNIPAERISRAENYCISDYDVRIVAKDLPIEVASDSKYSKVPFRHHTLLNTIEAKYCPSIEKIPVLYTRNHGKPGGVFSVRDDFFAGLLGYFLGFIEKEEVLRRWGI